MPSRIKKNGLYRYRASVEDPRSPGRRIQKLFPDDSKKSQKEAILWEEETRKALQQEAEIDTDSLTVRQWVEGYLDDVKARFVKKTYQEKRSTFKLLLNHPGVDSGMMVEGIDVQLAYEFLKLQFSTRSGYAANKDRKNLSAGWVWAASYQRNFPKGQANPFQGVKPFSEVRSPRYVPPVQDFWKVYDVVEGQQDQAMLLTFLHTAGRRGEVFRMKISDCDFTNDQIRLWTRKREGGTYEYDWLPMTSELRHSLLSWWEKRLGQPTIDKEHLFVCLEQTPFCDDYYGKPYSTRQHWMDRICKKAGVKPFGLHAIRHLTATVLYHNGYDVSFAQRILRHKHATTTQRYLQSLGLDATVRAGHEDGLKRPGEIVHFPKRKSL